LKATNHSNQKFKKKFGFGEPKLVNKTLVFIEKMEDVSLVFSLLVVVSLALLQIFLRNVFGFGFMWAESVLKILVLWIALLGAMVATRENQHIKIDLLERFLPPPALLFFRKMTNVFSAIICGLAAYWSADLVYYEFLDSTVAFGAVPVWLCQIIMPVAFCVMGLRFLSHGWHK